jgi:hypothetical protein
MITYLKESLIKHILDKVHDGMLLKSQSEIEAEIHRMNGFFLGLSFTDACRDDEIMSLSDKSFNILFERLQAIQGRDLALANQLHEVIHEVMDADDGEHLDLLKNSALEQIRLARDAGLLPNSVIDSLECKLEAYVSDAHFTINLLPLLASEGAD